MNLSEVLVCLACLERSYCYMCGGEEYIKWEVFKYVGSLLPSLFYREEVLIEKT